MSEDYENLLEQKRRIQARDNDIPLACPHCKRLIGYNVGINRAAAEGEPQQKDWADIKAEELLRCDGGWDDNAQCVPHGPEEIHRSGCPAKHKFYVAQALREAQQESDYRAVKNALDLCDARARIAALTTAVEYALRYLENLNIGADTAQVRLRAVLAGKRLDETARD